MAGSSQDRPFQDRPFEEPRQGGPPVVEGPHPERNEHDEAHGQLPGPAGTPVPRADKRPGPLPEEAREASPERRDDHREPGTGRPEGPHSQPSLTNPDATPGAGTLPDPGRAGSDTDIDSDASTG